MPADSRPQALGPGGTDAPVPREPKPREEGARTQARDTTKTPGRGRVSEKDPHNHGRHESNMERRGERWSPRAQTRETRPWARCVRVESGGETPHAGSVASARRRRNSSTEEARQQDCEDAVVEGTENRGSEAVRQRDCVRAEVEEAAAEAAERPEPSGGAEDRDCGAVESSSARTTRSGAPWNRTTARGHRGACQRRAGRHD